MRRNTMLSGVKLCGLQLHMHIQDKNLKELNKMHFKEQEISMANKHVVSCKCRILSMQGEIQVPVRAELLLSLPFRQHMTLVFKVDTSVNMYRFRSKTHCY